MNPHIFVYGTLLSGTGHPKGAQLGREARLLGAATIQGCSLYSLGRYPGLVEAADAQGPVHGEVYALNNPLVSLKWLDAYEGIVPGNHDQNQYERVERQVRLASGEEVSAWVYLYRKAVTGRLPIASGRWLSPTT
jgi:gamma-glutamylcyclotransferase (GGCT)/AIG2-like uncharacterized protein YtfP